MSTEEKDGPRYIQLERIDEGCEEHCHPLEELPEGSYYCVEIKSVYRFDRQADYDAFMDQCRDKYGEGTIPEVPPCPKRPVLVQRDEGQSSNGGGYVRATVLSVFPVIATTVGQIMDALTGDARDIPILPGDPTVKH